MHKKRDSDEDSKAAELDDLFWFDSDTWRGTSSARRRQRFVRWRIENVPTREGTTFESVVLAPKEDSEDVCAYRLCQIHTFADNSRLVGIQCGFALREELGKTSVLEEWMHLYCCGYLEHDEWVSEFISVADKKPRVVLDFPDSERIAWIDGVAYFVGAD